MNSNNYSRKDFITLLGLGAASLAFSKWNLKDKTGYSAPIAFQLYSVRKEIEKDFEATIHKLADMGYEGVETYALPANLTLTQAAKVFKECGLKVISMHTELPVGEQREKILKSAEAYDCEYIIYAGWPQGEKYKNLDAIKRTTDIYNESATFLKSKGLHFGLHNHWWEFEMIDGVYPFYYLLEHGDPKVFFEIDTYWAKTGGQNPMKIVKDFGARAPFLHIKDGPAIKGEKAYEQVPVGTGAMDFPTIVKAGRKNTKWMIVEFDEYAGNVFDGMQSSYKYLIRNHLAKGRV
jgi:sugar phosphate isomerase/epimerase